MAAVPSGAGLVGSPGSGDARLSVILLTTKIEDILEKPKES